MKLFVFAVSISLLVSGQLHARSAAHSCARLFEGSNKSKVIDYDQTITNWYFAVELGFHDKLIEQNMKSGMKKLLFLDHENPRDGSASYSNIFMMPKTDDNASSYFAKNSINRKSNKVEMILHPIEESKSLTNMTSKDMELTWNTYLKKNVVSKAEIETFKAAEEELSPQRKITFVTTTQRGRTLAIMRVYDGSPFPAMYMGRLGRQHEAPVTDVRLPIERRYPHLPLREKSQYIFEAGRLAKSEDIQGMLEYKFYNLGSYFMTKFGFAGVGPRDYIQNGRLYIEITGQYLETYMKSKEDGGMGFHLYAAQVGNQKMKLVDPKTTYKSLKVKPNTEDKFVMYLTTAEFINNFYMEVRVGTPEEAAEML